MEEYDNPNSTYNCNIWSENSNGYLVIESEISSSYKSPTNKEGENFSYGNTAGKEDFYNKAEEQEFEKDKEEKDLGKRTREIYDSQNHPFCFGTGMSINL